MTVEAMNYEAEQQKEFILNEETKANGIGYMTMERWNAVQDQLLEIKGLKEKQDVSKAFTIEFLKKNRKRCAAVDKHLSAFLRKKRIVGSTVKCGRMEESRCTANGTPTFGKI